MGNGILMEKGGFFEPVVLLRVRQWITTENGFRVHLWKSGVFRSKR